MFDTDTRAGAAFDIGLLLAILASIVVISAETVEPFATEHASLLKITEWTLTFLFTVEYTLRITVHERPGRYVFSVLGIIDLLSILPTYLAFLVPGLAQSAYVLRFLRALRLLRVFRLLRIGAFARESNRLLAALSASRYRITIFVTAVAILVVLQGALMYFIEAPQNPHFSSIPASIYWAIVTVTTVGYGDISPVTPVGQAIAATLMLFGYGMIAVPSGIVGAEMVMGRDDKRSAALARACPSCGFAETDEHAAFCRRCGTSLDGAERV